MQDDNDVKGLWSKFVVACGSTNTDKQKESAVWKALEKVVPSRLC
jgi:hypothetical protein